MANVDGGRGRAASRADLGVLAPSGRGEGRWQHRSVVLPAPASTLVGRERERAEVGELVATTRLVTLTGSGGCGKTRLALELALDVAARFEHGTWWVELSQVGDRDGVIQAVADAAGVREDPGRALRDTLTARLRAWHGLLVVDNCEHVVGACATLVAELLGSCPHVSVLATSWRSTGKHPGRCLHWRCLMRTRARLRKWQRRMR